MDDPFFAPPPFNAAEALVRLQRSLRDLRPLRERGSGFELNGQPVIELAVDGERVRAGLARRPARTPEWEQRELASAADVRQFTEEVKRRLGRWSDE